MPAHGAQLESESSQYVEMGHTPEHLPRESTGVMDEQVRHWPSVEQVAQSAGQDTHRPSLSLGSVPVGHVDTHSPVEVANSSDWVQDEHCVAVV